jgi:hypothetical protein
MKVIVFLISWVGLIISLAIVLSPVGSFSGIISSLAVHLNISRAVAGVTFYVFFMVMTLLFCGYVVERMVASDSEDARKNDK